MGRLIDLTGKKIGRWSIIKKTSNRTKTGEVLWLCECDCGTIKEVIGRAMARGTSSSCGCIQKEIASKLQLMKESKIGRAHV